MGLVPQRVIQYPGSLKLIPLILLGAASLASAAGNPGLRLALASSGAGVWRPGLTLAFRVTIEHPSVRDDTDTGSWTLDPRAGWASAVTLQVKDPDGQTLAWPFEPSARRETEARRLPAHAIALVGGTWDPDGPMHWRRRQSPDIMKSAPGWQPPTAPAGRARLNPSPSRWKSGGQFRLSFIWMHWGRASGRCTILAPSSGLLPPATDHQISKAAPCSS